MSGGTRLRAEPVALIAAGAVTPLGADLDAFWSGLVTGSDGISLIERFPVGDLRVRRGGEVKKPSVPGRASPGGCRAPGLLGAAAAGVLARAGPDAPPARPANLVGTAPGGGG